MTTFTALGDSITLGVGDPVRVDGQRRRRWRGWAGLLAGSLPEPELHNLATNGACAADIVADQLPSALRLRPDLASVVFGVNDTLRSGFSPERIREDATRTVGELREAGAEVLTMRLPDPGQMLGLPGVLARPLARRAHEVNDVMDAVAERFGTHHFDAAGDVATYERWMWAVDRLHPSERGHRHMARRFHELLTSAGYPVGPAPGAEPREPVPSRLAELSWMATKGTGWVVRRSVDMIPYLMVMAVREMRQP